MSGLLPCVYAHSTYDEFEVSRRCHRKQSAMRNVLRNFQPTEGGAIRLSVADFVIRVILLFYFLVRWTRRASPVPKRP